MRTLMSGMRSPRRKADVKNKAGLTPLNVAKKADNKEIVEYLSKLDSKAGKQDIYKKK